MTHYEKVIALLVSFGLAGLVGMVAMSVNVPAHMVWSIYAALIIGELLGLMIGKDE